MYILNGRAFSPIPDFRGEVIYPRIMSYVVLRYIYDDLGKFTEPPMVVWAGDDPKQFTGATGTTREDGKNITHEFAVDKRGKWYATEDPRPMEQQVNATIMDVVLGNSTDFDTIMGAEDPDEE